MRMLGAVLLAGVIGFGAAQKEPAAASVLEAGRRAVSGGTKVADVRSLVATGRRGGGAGDRCRRESVSPHDAETGGR
jgi:hypothetical protein